MRDVRFILETTYMTVGDEVYQQICGVPMGLSCSPMLAVIMLAWDEIPLVHEITARMQQWQQAAARREARERRAVRAIQRAWRAIPPESASASRRATRTSAASLSQA